MLQSVARQLAKGARRLAVPAAVRRFARRKDGSVAIEFGMVAAPFFALLFAIMETAIVFFAGQALETAVADSARLIMTGQAQSAGFDAGRSRTQSARRSTACSIARTASSSTSIPSRRSAM